jgi:hypothetical protein
MRRRRKQSDTVTKNGTLIVTTRHARPHQECEKRGLRYVTVRCAKCLARFTIPRLPEDVESAHSEGLLCEPCAKKRDTVASLTPTKHDRETSPLLPFVDV